MELKDFQLAKGDLVIVKRNEVTGKEERFEFKNLVTTVGKQWIAARLKDTGIPAQMSHMAIGSNNTAAAVGDTTLGTELARSALGTAGGTVTGAVVQFTASYAAGVGTGNVYEAGLFNASSGGTLVCHTVFGLVTKGANDSLTVTWNLTIS